MPIKISSALIKKLPPDEQGTKEEVSQKLWDKSGGHCFLCDGILVEASHEILADHDSPEDEGGPTQLNNLNLVHAYCNSFKRSHPTVDVRPYLKVLQKINSSGGYLKYDQAAALLGITPKKVALSTTADEVTLTLPSGETVSARIMRETNKAGTIRFCFVELPPEAIFNDDECQPRTIKPQHLWQLYSDVSRNPLHEQPACRVERDAASVNNHYLRMFDGQHKTLSFWIAGRKSIAMKIYLDLSKDAAVRLVNSVQSKIKKLPLSPFELSAKMAEEWRERVESYENDVGTENASEAGFIEWVERDERTRAKAAFTDALVQAVLDEENLSFRKIITKSGQKSESEYSISETAFKNKLLKELLHVSALQEKFLVSQKFRERERSAVVRLLNLMYSEVFEPKSGPEFTEQESRREKRFLYQSSLQYCSSLMRSVIGKMIYTQNGREFLEKDIEDATWEEISKHIRNLFSHPIWTADLKTSDKTKAVESALSKNQNAERAFGDVGLKPGYVVGMDKLPHDCLS